MRHVVLLPMLGLLALSTALAKPPSLAASANASASSDVTATTDAAANDCRPVTIAKGEHSGWGSNVGFAGADLIIDNPDAWGYFWQAHVGSTAPVPPPPVDFQRQLVIASIQGPQSSGGGPNIAITELVPRGPFVIIRVFDDRRPGPLAVITNPFHIVSVPRPCLPPGSIAFEHVAPIPDTSVVFGRVLGVRPDAATAAVPLPGAKVTLTAATAADVRTTFTGLDGSYFFVNVVAGPHQLGAEAPGFQPASVPLPVPPNALVGHEFVLQPLPVSPSSITGYTAQPGANGPAPLPGTLVELRQQDQAVQQTTSGPDGAYSFPQVAPGAYVLRASHDGFQPLAVPIVVGAGQAVVQDFVLQATSTTPGSITGHTAHPEQGALAPLAGTLVELLKQDQVVLQTLSGADGAYGFSEVVPDAYVLRASHDGFLPVAVPVIVGSGQSVVKDLVLPPRPPAQVGKFQGHVRGVSVSADEVPLGNALVRLLRSSANEIRHVRTDPQGFFVMSDIPPGHYSATVQRDGWQPASAEIDIVAGQTTEHDFVLQPTPPPAAVLDK